MILIKSYEYYLYVLSKITLISYNLLALINRDTPLQDVSILTLPVAEVPVAEVSVIELFFQLAHCFFSLFPV